MNRRTFLLSLIPAANPKAKIAKEQTEKVRLRNRTYYVTTSTIKGRLEEGLAVAVPIMDCQSCRTTLIDNKGNDYIQEWRAKE